MKSKSLAKKKSSLSPVKARHRLWLQGKFSRWYLRPYQEEIIDFIRKTEDPFIEAARQIGKTTTILAHVNDVSAVTKAHVTRWCEPFKNQAREIIMPEMDKQQDTAHPDYAAKWTQMDSYYVYPNKSRMYLRGINEDKGKSARGSFAHIVVADEFGFWTSPQALDTVLRPQLRTTNGKCIIASTPPDDLGHPYYEMRERAKRQNRFLRKTILEVGLSDEEIEKIAEQYGGKASPTFRREFLCEEVANPAQLVVPEFDEKIHVLPNDHPRPPYYDAYVGADLGFQDFTGLVFLYHDFATQTIVIEDELCVSGWNSKQVVEAAIDKERQLWNNAQPLARWSDNDLQQLHDMATLHGYYMHPVQKAPGYKEAAVNELRLRFQMQKIKIKKRCTNLIFQLKVGMWNTQKSNFMRGEITGHLDLIDALIYAHKNVDTRRNPWPKHINTGISTHIILESEDEALQNKQLQDAFGNPFGGR